MTQEELLQAVGEGGERRRRHFDVLMEKVRADLRLVAEQQAALLHKIDDFRIELKADLVALDRRLMRLEASPK